MITMPSRCTASRASGEVKNSRSARTCHPVVDLARYTVSQARVHGPLAEAGWQFVEQLRWQLPSSRRPGRSCRGRRDRPPADPAVATRHVLTTPARPVDTISWRQAQIRCRRARLGPGNASPGGSGSARWRGPPRFATSAPAQLIQICLRGAPDRWTGGSGHCRRAAKEPSRQEPPGPSGRWRSR